MKCVRVPVAAAFVSLGLAGCIGGPPKGSAAPQFEATTAAGEVVTLAAYDGDVLVLDFFATWCAPCRDASPRVQQLHERWADNPNVHIVAVHFDTNYRYATPGDYFAEHGYTFALIPDGREIVKAYDIRQLPAFVVVGRDGTVIHTQWNFRTADIERFSRMIETELGS